MFWLLISILLSSSLLLLFRWFPQAGIQTPSAILINYLVCVVTGSIQAGDRHIFREDLWQKSWFWPCLALGILFIVVFNAMGQSARIAGSSLTAMASKMGLLIPVLMSVLFLGEPWHWTLLPGLCGTFIALYLLNPGKGAEASFALKSLLLLLLVFVGSGMVDAGVKLVQFYFMKEAGADQTATLIFCGAFLSGLLFQLVQKNESTRFPSLKDIGGGLILGLCNYGSIYTLMNALSQHEYPASFIFPMNNLGVVIVTTAASIALFKERLSGRQLAGLGLAAFAIVLLSIYH